jgi:hypothetical protein
VVVVVDDGAVEASVVEVVTPGGSVVVTSTVGGTVTVACESSVAVGWASSAGQKMSGAHRAITARAAPTALSAFRIGITSGEPTANVANRLRPSL